MTILKKYNEVLTSIAINKFIYNIKTLPLI